MKKTISLLACAAMAFSMLTAGTVLAENGEHTLIDHASQDKVYTFWNDNTTVTPHSFELRNDLSLTGDDSLAFRFPDKGRDTYSEFAVYLQNEVSAPDESGATTVYKNNILTDWSNYSYLNMWIYNYTPTNATFTLRLSGDASYWLDIAKLDWTGWKLVSVMLDSFGCGGTKTFKNLTKMFFKCTPDAASATESYRYPQTSQIFMDRMWLSATQPAIYNSYVNNVIYSDDFNTEDVGNWLSAEKYTYPDTAGSGVIARNPADTKSVKDGDSDKAVKMIFSKTNGEKNRSFCRKLTAEQAAKLANAKKIVTSFDLWFENGVRFMVLGENNSTVLDLTKEPGTNYLGDSTQNIGWFNRGRTWHVDIIIDKVNNTMSAWKNGEYLGERQLKDGINYDNLMFYVSEWGNTDNVGNAAYVDNVTVSCTDAEEIVKEGNSYSYVMPVNTENATAVFAEYDENDGLCGVRTYSLKAPVVQENTYVYNRPFFKASYVPESGHSAKLFVWDSLNSLKPIAQAK